jgi:DNA-binding CsgD family transcriptional regulator
MLSSEIYALLRKTLEAGVAISQGGVVKFCNQQAGLLLEIPPADITARCCIDLIAGKGELGEPICGPNCLVRERAAVGQATEPFDCEIRVGETSKWVNVSTLIVSTREDKVLIVHLMRDIDDKKKLEAVTRRFLDQVSGLSGETMEQLLHAASPHLDLSDREKAVLKHLVDGHSTKHIANELGVSTTTIRNHVNHLLHKLSAHSRTEAVLRAVREKLV